MTERTYHESEWAARRWDWFNEGRVVKPRSFCQFWRTVLIYATLKQFFTRPFRSLAKSVGGAALKGIVTAGEPIDSFGQRHIRVFKLLGWSLIGAYAIGAAALFLAPAYTASWFWTLLGVVAGVVVILALYGIVKCGVIKLVWEAAVAAKHGICPPVEIVRHDVVEGRDGLS